MPERFVMLLAAALIEMNRAWIALITDGAIEADKHCEFARGLLKAAGKKLGDGHESILDAWDLVAELAGEIRKARTTDETQQEATT